MVKVKNKQISSRFVWSDAELQAWALPDKITVSRWADLYRVLDESSAEPGQWNTNRVPYMREVMDTFTDPRIETIVLKTSTQVGKTQCINNMIGYCVDQDPGPTLYVLPTREDSEDVALHTIRPFVFSNKTMMQHLTGHEDDITKKKIVFGRMILYLTGSNSPSALARRAIRYLFLDEVNKYPLFSGREANPIKLASERQRTFWNRKRVISSTPTTPAGYITREYKRSDQREYYVPCPHCGHYQTLKWPNVKFPKDERDPMLIKLNRLAWYQCIQCKGRIEDKDKQVMLENGKWICSGQKISKNGLITGDRPDNDTAGFWINSLYSPWLTFSEIAAEWISSQPDIDSLMNFINSWLAEEFEEKVEEVTPDILNKNVDVYPPAFIPEGAALLTAGVDVQQDHFYFVIRAWGYGEESWLIRQGRLESWEQITGVLFNTKYYRVDRKSYLSVRLACFDSPYRTDEVYDYCRRRPESRATKGQQHQKAPWYGSKIDSHPLKGGKIAQGLTLWLLDTSYFKDKIHRLVNIQRGEIGCWHLHKEVTQDYKEQFCAEVKSVHVDKRTRRSMEFWHKRTSGIQNHYLDCEVGATAAADMMGIKFMIKEEVDKFIGSTLYQETPSSRRREKEKGYTEDGNWDLGHKGDWTSR
jgi:phage terminase large subunit GpA-like protein